MLKLFAQSSEFFCGVIHPAIPNLIWRCPTNSKITSELQESSTQWTGLAWFTRMPHARVERSAREGCPVCRADRFSPAGHNLLLRNRARPLLLDSTKYRNHSGRSWPPAPSNGQLKSSGRRGRARRVPDRTGNRGEHRGINGPAHEALNPSEAGQRANRPQERSASQAESAVGSVGASARPTSSWLGSALTPHRSKNLRNSRSARGVSEWSFVA